jgi:spore coat polysaccharide biosynthesis predicted glycosyltransferase SpsG
VWFFADIAPRYRAASPSGKNPPIYTVLNAGDLTPGTGKIKFSMKLAQNVKKRNLTNLYIKNRKYELILKKMSGGLCKEDKNLNIFKEFFEKRQ